MAGRVRVNHGHVKIGHMQRLKPNGTKTAGKLSLRGGAISGDDTNLDRLRHSLRALSISGKKPKYISF